MPIVKPSTKYQIVIPKDIRRKLNIKPNKPLLLEVVKDHIELTPLSDDPIKALTGFLRDHPTSLAKELIEERRVDDKIDERHTF